MTHFVAPSSSPERLGDLLTATHGIIVHGCNAQGVMNSGVAKAIRARYPGAFTAYRRAYDAAVAAGQRQLTVGEVIWYEVPADQRPGPAPLWIANAITQAFYGRTPGHRYVDYHGLHQAFEDVGARARQWGLPVHYPRVGAGLGGGDWGTIESLINEALAGVSHTLWVPEGEATVLSAPSPTPRWDPRLAVGRSTPGQADVHSSALSTTIAEVHPGEPTRRWQRSRS